MKILIACEMSGIVRNAFALAGHDVISVDLKESLSPGHHIIGDIRNYLSLDWDMIIAFPPCTYLAKCQIFRLHTDENRREKCIESLKLIYDIWNCGCKKICIENPPDLLSSVFMYPSQVIQPFNFGDPFKKQTCLFLKNLPPLIDTVISVSRKPRQNNVNSRMSQTLKTEIKSTFYPGIAAAMVIQWT